MCICVKILFIHFYASVTNKSSKNNNKSIYETINNNNSSTNNNHNTSTPPETEPRKIYFRPPIPRNSILRQHGLILKNKKEEE